MLYTKVETRQGNIYLIFLDSVLQKNLRLTIVRPNLHMYMYMLILKKVPTI